MTVIGALCVGACCALGAGLLLGTLPHWRVRRPSLPRVTRRIGVGVGVGALTLLGVSALSGSAFVALVPAVAVGMLPRAYAAREQRRRVRATQAAWPDALRELLASISAGSSVAQAVTGLAVHGPEPLRGAFVRFPELARMLGTAPALELVKDELADATSDRVIEVLMLAHDRGGAIVRTILEDLVTATTRDVRLLDELETEGLEMRINARAVVILPWLVLVALTARAGPFRTFYRSAAGIETLLVAALLTIVGMALLSWLGREPAEPRVFGGAQT